MLPTIAIGYMVFTLVWGLLWFMFYKTQGSDNSGDGFLGILAIMAIPLIPLLLPILIIGRMVVELRDERRN